MEFRKTWSIPRRIQQPVFFLGQYVVFAQEIGSFGHASSANCATYSSHRGIEVMTSISTPLRSRVIKCLWPKDSSRSASGIGKFLADRSYPPFVLNLSAPEWVNLRPLAQKCGELFDREPVFNGSENAQAWGADTSLQQSRFGYLSVPLTGLINWTVHWMQGGGAIFVQAQAPRGSHRCA